MLSEMKFKIILWGMAQLLKYAAWRYPTFRARLNERNLVAQLKARDEEIGRWYAIRDGRISSGAGLRPDADVTLAFKTASFGVALLMPPINWLDQINAQKDFKLTVEGPEDLSNWFAQTIMMSQSVGLKIGTRLADGTMRYCNMTNGGPVFVYVKDGKIVRMTPINFGADDPQPWTIEARGLKFTPPRKTTLAPHGQNAKSIVYSPDRLLYPMKRVDFDPNGERNPQNRGKSGYVRISWAEALDLVGSEIKRLKSTFGPGVMAVSHGSHHTWGNIGYYLSALYRFRNAVGYTQIHPNPDSVEGLPRRRRGRHPEDAGMAGSRNRRAGERRARARPRMGAQARLSRARRLGQQPRRRLPQPDRHPVGARDGVPLGDAGARQARL